MLYLLQIENEFGSYGNVRGNPLDLQYMMHLVGLAQQYLGNSTVLYTTDGGDTGYLSRGALNISSVYAIGDFGCAYSHIIIFSALIWRFQSRL